MKLSSQSERAVQSELIYFKEDILKTLKMIESKLSLKQEESSSTLSSTLTSYDNKLDTFSQKITDLSNLISTDNSLREKVNLLDSFKTNAENQITTHEIKINRTEKDLQNSIYKYDKALSDNLYYPGIMGNGCRFPSLKSFVDFSLSNISSLNSFKDKQILDLKSYKNKLDSLIKSFQSQIDSVTLTITQFVDKKIHESESKFKELMQIYDDRLEDMRVENGKYAISLKTSSENMQNEWKNVINIKEEIFQKFNKEVNDLKHRENIVIQNFDNFKSEFKLIKNRFTQLSEFIKDLRFRKNVGKENLSKKEAMKMSNLINFKKRQAFVEDTPSNVLTNSIIDSNSPKNNIEQSNERRRHAASFHTSNDKNKSSNALKSLRGSVIAESFLKKYINGEVDLSTVMSPSSRKSLNCVNTLDSMKKSSPIKRQESLNSKHSLKSSVELKLQDNYSPLNKIEPFNENDTKLRKDSSDDSSNIDKSEMVNQSIISEERSDIEGKFKSEDEKMANEIKENKQSNNNHKQSRSKSNNPISESINNKHRPKFQKPQPLETNKIELKQSKSYTIFPPLSKQALTNKYNRNKVNKELNIIDNNDNYNGFSDSSNNYQRKQKMMKNIFTSKTTKGKELNMFRTFNNDSLKVNALTMRDNKNIPIIKRKNKIKLNNNLLEEDVKGGVHYLTLSKILTHEPKTLPNDKNNIFLSNPEQYYIREEDYE